MRGSSCDVGDASRDQVLLAGKIRDPEAVDHIVRLQRDFGRNADGQVKFVRRAERFSKRRRRRISTSHHHWLAVTVDVKLRPAAAFAAFERSVKKLAIVSADQIRPRSGPPKPISAGRNCASRSVMLADHRRSALRERLPTQGSQQQPATTMTYMIVQTTRKMVNSWMKLLRFRAIVRRAWSAICPSSRRGRASTMMPRCRASLLGRSPPAASGSRFVCVWGGVLLTSSARALTASLRSCPDSVRT